MLNRQMFACQRCKYLVLEEGIPGGECHRNGAVYHINAGLVYDNVKICLSRDDKEEEDLLT